ncbi:hypothetical protein [Desulfitobacterium sp.]|uniref:hypothetical protein n=1 Tax=Desulfitobacterium sp. TaxID=49981 RepID=UPI002C1C630E|nr:hypothetical protein [Desulfitobacterium sp.]HVJ47697.1 hypothetical protein [Desulfitobacterium sp.]
MSTLKKGVMVSLLSLSLVMSLTSITLAAGSIDGMDPNMQGMDMGASASTAPNTQHEATPGMDPNMPGMESNPSTDGHGENGGSEGVNWTVVGSFLAVNLLVIGTAGVLKFTRKPKLEILE